MCAAIPSLLVTLIMAPDHFWYVILMFLIVQTIQGYGLSPLIMRLGVKLSVLALIVSVLAMGTLFGLMGVLVAVPLTADTIVLWRYFNRMFAKDHAARELKASPPPRPDAL
jgi:predicted PurR-regulated permease PerM